MNLFKNMKLGVKIIAGYVVVIILLAALGGVALQRLNQIDLTVEDLTGNLAVDQGIVDDTLARSLRARFRAAKHIESGSQSDLDRYQEHMDIIDTLLAEADVEIQDLERVEMLTGLKGDIAEFDQNFTQVEELIDERNEVVTGILDVQGPLGEEKLRQLRASAFQDDDATAANYAGDAQAALLLMRFNAFKYLQDGDETYVDLLDQRYDEAMSAFAALDRELQDPARRQLSEEAKAAVESYDAAFVTLREGYVLQNQLEASLDEIGPKLEAWGVGLSDSVSEDFEAATTSSHQLVSSSVAILIVFIVVAVVVGLGLGILITRSITGPVSKVVQASQQIAEVDLDTLAVEMDALAHGDLTRSLKIVAQPLAIDSQDEIGILAKAFDTIIERLQNTGTAFDGMTENLRGSMSQVAENAASLSAASEQLSAAADQSGSATTQITSTIQEVAKGTQQQAASVTNTASSVEQLTRAIDGVSKGSEEQAEAVNQASQITSQISSTIEQVAGNAQAVTENATSASEAAENGSRTIEQTISGMHTIRDKVGVSAKRVQEMGERSDAIGAIVDTITDIASQTNLLALNAAIEAARAGEHGKGFAVVADEVRKLAERSAVATNEIGDLIKEIQRTVTDAVAAMDEGSQEVESGVERANEAGGALSDIMEAIEAVRQQSEQTAAASEEMSAASGELVASMDTVSAVVEENTAAAEEMSASSGEVSQAIETIASISEENSAAIEEVSASTEEMSAQVEEVTASASSLSDMAGELTVLVSQFKLGASQDLRRQMHVFEVAHLEWVNKLNKMLEGALHIKEEQAASHTDCIMGRWYYTAGTRDFGDVEEFKSIEEPHIHFHESVLEAVKAQDRGDVEAARKHTDKADALSKELVNSLHLLENLAD